MSRLIWAFLGFVGGIAAARNAAPLPSPAVGVLVLVLVVACGLVWFAAYRGKSTAVASAVAVAVAKASASADAQAAAIAQAAVHLHLSGALDGPSGSYVVTDGERHASLDRAESANADRSGEGWVSPSRSENVSKPRHAHWSL